jgi:hypothetical protein
MKALPANWTVLNENEAPSFETQLAKEAPPNHPLFGRNVTCLARCKGSDDFLFHVHDCRQPYAIVHLTWSTGSSSDFPWTTFFADEAQLEKGLEQLP